jgi:hypothetical protein
MNRDKWDWVVLGVGLAAGATAIVGFLFWIARQRRRPEVDFLWRLASTGDPARFARWMQDDNAKITVGDTILVEASIQNIGDAAAARALANFVVPDCFSLMMYPDPSRAQMRTSHNSIAGIGPDYGVNFVAPERELHVGMWWQLRFSLTLERAPNSSGVRLLMEIGDERLNANGWRWFWSLMPADKQEGAPHGTPWPPPRHRRRLGFLRVGARDGNRIYCTPGLRRSTRDLVVTAARGG